MFHNACRAREALLLQRVRDLEAMMEGKELEWAKEREKLLKHLPQFRIPLSSASPHILTYVDLAMRQVKAELSDVNSKLLSSLAAIDRRHRGELVFLSGALEFFKNLRNAYRMAVGAEDQLRPEYLHIVASAMGLEYGDEEEAGNRLLLAYRGCTTQVA